MGASNGTQSGTFMHKIMQKIMQAINIDYKKIRNQASILATAILLTALPGVASAEKIKNTVAVFSGIDKITGRIISFDVYVDETVQFGALQVTPRVCYSRPITEKPKTTSFLEVDEITLDRNIRRIFTGWMFADSPGLNAVEHPVYDIWLTNCKMQSDVAPPEDVPTSEVSTPSEGATNP